LNETIFLKQVQQRNYNAKKSNPAFPSTGKQYFYQQVMRDGGNLEIWEGGSAMSDER